MLLTTLEEILSEIFQRKTKEKSKKEKIFLNSLKSNKKNSNYTPPKKKRK